MKWFICGTRKKGYAPLVREVLGHFVIDKHDTVIHGDCPDSADRYADEWAAEREYSIEKFPGTPGNYLKRNIEMAEACDICIAFWDGFSYGTAHSIAWVTKLKKSVIIYAV